MQTKKKLTIAIDGPAGSGKSSTAKKVAEELGYVFLDSGAMYRAVTLFLLAEGADPHDPAASCTAAQQTDICFERTEHGQRVFLNGRDVTKDIRAPFVTKNIAPVAANPDVRNVLVQKQREIGKDGGIVAEGRDIGTVVFPNADLKIFMVASIKERVKRREQELVTKGIKVDIHKLAKEIRERDESDSTREHGALLKAPDAIRVDTSTLTLDEQVTLIVEKAKQRGA